MSTSTQRTLAIFILSLWMAVMAGPSAVGLHLALAPHHAHDHHAHDHHDHGHPHDLPASPEAALVELAHAASHGHDHAETAPEHEHEAVVDDSPLRKPNAGAAPPGASLGVTASETPAPRPRTWRHPPRHGPTPLFRAHCSLLL